MLSTTLDAADRHGAVRDQHRLQAGKELLASAQGLRTAKQARASAGGSFSKSILRDSRLDAEKLMKIARAENPEAAAEIARKYDRLAQAKRREKSKREDEFIARFAPTTLKPAPAEPPQRYMRLTALPNGCPDLVGGTH